MKELINFIFLNQHLASQENLKKKKKKFNCHINLSRQRIFNDEIIFFKRNDNFIIMIYNKIESYVYLQDI